MQQRQGFTLIEMMVAVAVAGILLGLVSLGLRTPSALLYANDVQSLIAQSRLQAVKHNRPVVVLWDADNQEFTNRTAEDDDQTVSGACDSDDILTTKATSDYSGSLEVDPDIGNGLVWLPSGLLTTCDGTPDGAMSIAITGGSVDKQLSISVTGKVSIQ